MTCAIQSHCLLSTRLLWPIMGVRRLFSDLQPFAETVYLGSGTDPVTDTASITNLVIDGPSLIYHVYSKLVNYRLSGCQTMSLQMLPSYAEVNESTKRYLETLKNHGVMVSSIFFDGALPAHKRETRLERLEQSRRELEHYRRANHNSHGQLVANVLSPDDQHSALWRPAAASYRQQLPPAPPLMVASAIEALRLDSTWQGIVSVVPEEGDVACARAVSDMNTAAVLSNDSDLALYELGHGNRLLLLHSLEVQELTPPGLTQMYGQAIDPRQIAVQLKISSMLRFGFERYSDASTSTATVLRKAKDDTRHMSLKHEYENFSVQYQIQRQNSTRSDANHFDPRVAEIFNHIEADIGSVESVCIYLPMLHEDPARTSSWSYGAHLRQTAYSLVGNHTQRPFKEYERKGARIADTIITRFDGQELVRRVSNIAALVEVVAGSENDQPLPNCARLNVISWWTLALHTVISSKLSNGLKANMRSAHRLLGFGNMNNEKPVNWDDLHLHANAQAVLYSLRMLKQVLSHDAALHHADRGLTRKVAQLKRCLEGMPTIAELFLDPWALRKLASSVPSDSLSMALTPIRHLQQQPRDHSLSSSAPRHATDAMKTHGPRVRQRFRTNCPRISATTNPFSLLTEG